MHGRVVRKIDARRREILHLSRAVAERRAFDEEAARNFFDAREIQRPEREVHKVNAEVNDAATSGKFRVGEPRLVRAVCVVKNDVDGENAAERALANQFVNLLHARGVAIREVHAQ